VIFRRKKDSDAEQAMEPDVDDELDELDELATERPHGPWDRDETSADRDDTGYIDLGGLVVKGAPELELRLQIDEQGSAVTSVMLAGPQSGLELRAFAAPRSGGIWDDVRTDIAAEATKRGGTATELDGEFGTELKISVPIQTPDGRQGTQTSRIVGVDGPRWLLRGTFLGKSASDPDPDGVVERAFRDVIVVRGSGPMAPRELIAMQVPSEAQAVLEDSAEGGEAGESADVQPD
jgi:hypothetical protein